MTDSNLKLSKRAAIFDACVSEMSPQLQEDYKKLAEWVAENILWYGGGVDSAKELIVQAIRWTGDNHER